jgi:hypothetical protein
MGPRPHGTWLHHPPLLLAPVCPIYYTVTPTNNYIAMYTVDIATTITIAIASGCSPVTIAVIITIVIIVTYLASHIEASKCGLGLWHCVVRPWLNPLPLPTASFFRVYITGDQSLVWSI